LQEGALGALGRGRVIDRERAIVRRHSGRAVEDPV
jgi:hypothetical protein